MYTCFIPCTKVYSIVTVYNAQILTTERKNRVRDSKLFTVKTRLLKVSINLVLYASILSVA